MEEYLICTQCSTKWSRLKTRGRKPLLCPSCINPDIKSSSLSPEKVKKSKIISSSKKNSKSSEDISISSISSVPDPSNDNFSQSLLSKAKIMQICHPKPSNYKELLESTKNGSVWKCKSCGHILTLTLAVTDIPLHRCTPDTVTLKLYERIK